MRAIITLPPALVRRADRLARGMRKTRSEVVCAAVAEYVARHAPEAVTAALNLQAEQLDTRLDAATSEAALQVLRRSDW
jgi:predicted transcriptional regulator